MSERTLFILLFLLPGGFILAPFGLWLFRKYRAANSSGVNTSMTNDLKVEPEDLSATTLMEYENGSVTHEQIAKLLEAKGNPEAAADLRRVGRKFSYIGLCVAAAFIGMLLAVWVLQ